MNPERLRRAPNIAIVGASSPLGKELKEVLENSAFPLGKLTQLETEEYAGLLQEFAGEIQITQILSPHVFADIDIAFFACSPEIIRSYAASGSPFPDLTVDLTQTRLDGILFMDGLSDPARLKDSRYIVTPHPAAIVIARTLSQLAKSFSVERASVTVILPASERGSTGVDELQEQTVALLNFQPFESRVFSGQLAFNLLSEAEAANQIEGRLRHQLRDLMPAPAPMPVIAAVQAPVFHSHTFSMFVTLAGRPAEEEVAHCLNESHGAIAVDSGTEGSSSPVTVVGSDAIRVGRLCADPAVAGNYFLWLVADNLRIAAHNAIRIAEAIILAPAAPH